MNYLLRMAESLSGSPIGSAPETEFERLLLKEPSVFDKLLTAEFKPGRVSDFERLLAKDFKPATAETIAPKAKFRAKLSGGRVRVSGAANLIGLLIMEKDISDFFSRVKQKPAKALGFADVDEMHKAFEDVAIGAEFADVAAQVLDQTRGMLEYKRKKKRKGVKRTVIYGFTRR